MQFPQMEQQHVLWGIMGCDCWFCYILYFPKMSIESSRLNGVVAGVGYVTLCSLWVKYVQSPAQELFGSNEKDTHISAYFKNALATQ